MYRQRESQAVLAQSHDHLGSHKNDDIKNENEALAGVAQ